MVQTKRHNEDVRKAIADSGFKQYEIAYFMGVSKYTLNSWLQIPLTDTRKEKILQAIKEHQ